MLPTPKSEILLALTAGDTPALGNIWRITAKKTDFYLDTVGPTGDAMHVSLHGPSGTFTGVQIGERTPVRRARPGQRPELGTQSARPAWSAAAVGSGSSSSWPHAGQLSTSNGASPASGTPSPPASGRRASTVSRLRC